MTNFNNNIVFTHSPSPGMAILSEIRRRFEADASTSSIIVSLQQALRAHAATKGVDEVHQNFITLIHYLVTRERELWDEEREREAKRRRHPLLLPPGTSDERADEILELYGIFTGEIRAATNEAIRAHIAEGPPEGLNAQQATYDHLEAVYEGQYDEMQRLRRRLTIYERREKELEAALTRLDITSLAEKMARVRTEMKRIESGQKRSGAITDAMIAAAKAYPFDRLIDVNRAGMALCPFHRDTMPSFHINRDNYGRCYGCAWHGDTIAYVMAKSKLTFAQAVTQLVTA